MKTIQHPAALPRPTQLSIAAFSEALATGDVRGGLFSSRQPNGFANLIEKFKADGYQVGEPVRETAPQFQVHGSTTWRLHVTTPKASCDLHFFIPENVS